MNQIMKRISLILITVCSLMQFFPAISQAANQYPRPDEQRYDYVINSYDINMVVNENNTFDITETIVAYFNQPRHGIYRKLPLMNTIKRLDGTTSKNLAKVSDITVNEEFSKSVSDSICQLKVGSARQTLTGEQSYTIRYHYNIGKDPLKNCDELYFNLIGNEWDTIIKNFTFQISMPKEFDAEQLGFSTGAKGSTENDLIEYHVSGNTITGSYLDTLTPGEAVTVRMELPEGYFGKAKFQGGTVAYLVFIIPSICLLLAFLLWMKFGKSERSVETVEFYPPEGFNSLEVGYLFRGKATDEDVISLLIYLANEGYIKILESTDEFKIIKLKDYQGNNDSEREFLNGLFQSGSKEVTSSKLRNKFYLTVNQIKYKISSGENKSKFFTKIPFGTITLMYLLLLTTLGTATAVPTLQYGGLNIFLATFLAVLFYAIFYKVIFFSDTILAARIIFGTFIIIHSGLFFLFLPSTKIILIEPFYLFSSLYAVFCIVAIGYFRKTIPKRTSYGSQMLTKIKGFKRFLETAEKDKLEALVMQDPAYFYNILPYTYVLGVSDKWIKKFESISLQSPSWYRSHTGFSNRHFHSFMKSTMRTAKKTMSSGSSRGGRSSGGGRAGGGSGGGGGGSW